MVKRSVPHKPSIGPLRAAPYFRVASYGQYLANWFNRPGKGSGSNLRQRLLLLLLGFGTQLKESDQTAGKKKRARWPAEADREVRSRLSREWTSRTLDALSVGTVGPRPHPTTGPILRRKERHSVLDFPGGSIEWRTRYIVRFVPPPSEGSRIHVIWWASDQLSAVTAAVAILLHARALHLVRPCHTCKQFFFARRADALFCCGNCRVTHWKRTPEGKEKHKAYMRQYRLNPRARRQSGARTRSEGGRLAGVVRNLGKSRKRGK